MREELAIRVSNLSKRYTIGKQLDGNLRSTITNLFKKKSTKKSDFWALQDLTIEINKGDIVGIVGKNGAGKSTFLKVLSKITKPTKGRIEINGRMASLLEVGTGFHPELTGRENIYLNGTILGMTRREVKSKFDEIVAFSGVEKFIDTPVKHYSSGMYVRLAFAVAAHLEPEILVIDEVLAVGDAEFQKKCLGKMQEVSKQGRTVLFVSHNLGAVKQLCNRGILLNKGQLVASGEIEDIVKMYQSQSQTETVYTAQKSDQEFYIKTAQVTGESSQFYHNEAIHFDFELAHHSTDLVNKFLLIRVMDEFEQVICSFETPLSADKNTHTLIVPPNTFVKGNYKLNGIIYHPAVKQYDNVPEFCKFEVLDNISAFSHLESFDTGKVYVEHQWI